MTNNQQSSYRQIVKATSIFGGVQIFNIIIAIVRSKFIAVLLGPAGMGISGLLTSTTGLITGLTNFGLGTSAVKNVAEANGTGDKGRIAVTVTVIRRLMWITGLLGMIITIVFAPLLSRLTFGNGDYTYAFVLISVTLLLTQLSSGQMVLLQGMRKLQYLARADFSGSILGLLITIPLYYWLGIKGIVPAIVITAVMMLIRSWYFANKIEIEKVSVSRTTTIIEGKEMLTMGFMISLSGMIMLGSSYIVKVFISNYGGVEQVGLYNAGFTIINTYVGLVFTAMATDYYPRLSAVAHSNEECRKIVNQQAEIAILILAPIIILFVVFIKWIVIVLYSTKFISLNGMILWAALGMFFKAASWAIAFIFLAKGKSKLFFWSELVTNIYMLFLNLAGYYLYALNGLGISFLIGYIIYLIQVFIIANLKFEFNVNQEMKIIFVLQFALILSAFIPALLIGGIISYFSGSIIFLISILHSYRELDRRIGIYTIIDNLLSKYKKL